jgi:hypothetical protein
VVGVLLGTKRSHDGTTKHDGAHLPGRRNNTRPSEVGFRFRSRKAAVGVAGWCRTHSP